MELTADAGKALEEERSPSFIRGALPLEWRRFFIPLRVLISVGLFLRFYLHDVPLRGLLASASVIWVASLILTFVQQKMPRRERELCIVVIALDISSVSMFYWCTDRVQSDLYIFYCLPILTAAEWLGARAVSRTAVVAAATYAGVVLLMPQPGDLTWQSVSSLTVRVLAPREFFFFGLTFVLALRLHQDREWSREQAERLKGMGRDLEYASQAPQVLEKVTARAADCGFDCAVGLLLEPVARASGKVVSAYDRRGSGKPNSELLAACERVAAGGVDPRVAPVVVHGKIVGALGACTEGQQPQDAQIEYLRGLAEQVAVASERMELFWGLRQIGAAASTVVGLNEELEAMLDEVERLGFKYATISLVDQYVGQIRGVRGRNVPPGWLARSQHDLEAAPLDIQARVVTTGRAEQPNDDDPGLDRAIFTRYHHERLARVFVPIVSRLGNIGTIEAGCEKARKTELLTISNVAALEKLGRGRGDAIATKMPHILLELSARHALDLVGADSASVHVFRGDWEQREQLLVAGVGVDKEFLRRYPPRKDGLGRQASRLNKAQWKNDLESTCHPLFAEGIHAIAAFPLQLGLKVFGVLYVHHMQPHEFADAELEAVDVLVPQIELAIQNQLVLEDMSRADDRTGIILGLQSVLDALSSKRPLKELLQKLAEKALYLLDATNVTLYQYYEKEKRFEFPAITEGEFVSREDMRTEVLKDDIVHKIVQMPGPRFLQNVPEEKLLREARQDDVRRKRFADRENIQSCIILPLRAQPAGEVVGCLFANYTKRLELSAKEERALINLAGSIASAGAICIKVGRLSSQVEQDLERTKEEVAALQKINHSIVSTARRPDREQTCKVILDQALRVLHARVGDVTIWTPGTKTLDIVFQTGYPNDGAISVSMGHGVVGRAAETKQTQCHNNVADVPHYRVVHPGTRAELAVPMLDQGQHALLGVINIEHDSLGAFDERAQAFLETLAIQGAIALHSVDQYSELQRQLRQALSLSTIVARIQAVQVELPAEVQSAVLWRLLLTGLTAEEGLGFSRAMLFEVDETRGTNGRVLRGTLGVGSLSRDAAQQTWNNLKAMASEIRASGGDFLAWLLNDAERSARSAAEGSSDETAFSRAVRGLTIELDGAIMEELAPSVRSSAWPRVVTADQSDRVRQQLGSLYPLDEKAAIAYVPIRRKSRLVALLVVDRLFLHDQAQIESTYEPILSAFAELAAISIGSIELGARVAEEQQLRNWRYATHKIAHMLKANVMNMQQESNAVSSYLCTDDLEGAADALQNLMESIATTSTILTEYDNFSRPVTLKRGEVELVALLEKTRQRLESSLRCAIELDAPARLTLHADPDRLSQLFDDLIANAQRALVQADKSQTPITIRVRHNNELGVDIEVIDQGPGVAPALEETLFEPFVSGYRSSGLGLAIARELVQLHGGEIRYRRGDPGACFTIRLPVQAAPN